MVPADVPKATIVMPFGLFKYMYMLFELKKASQTFQQLMGWIFATFPSSSFTWMTIN
jgi:hypothetical protein